MQANWVSIKSESENYLLATHFAEGQIRVYSHILIIANNVLLITIAYLNETSFPEFKWREERVSHS